MLGTGIFLCFRLCMLLQPKRSTHSGPLTSTPNLIAGCCWQLNDCLFLLGCIFCWHLPPSQLNVLKIFNWGGKKIQLLSCFELVPRNAPRSQSCLVWKWATQPCLLKNASFPALFSAKLQRWARKQEEVWEIWNLTPRTALLCSSEVGATAVTVSVSYCAHACILCGWFQDFVSHGHELLGCLVEFLLKLLPWQCGHGDWKCICLLPPPPLAFCCWNSIGSEFWTSLQ